MREPGSGTRRVVEEVLKKHGIAASGLHVLMTLGNTESIKMYLAHSPACSFLSSLAVREELKRGDLKKIHLRHLEIRRSFHFANGHGETTAESMNYSSNSAGIIITKSNRL